MVEGTDTKKRGKKRERERWGKDNKWKGKVTKGEQCK